MPSLNYAEHSIKLFYLACFQLSDEVSRDISKREIERRLMVFVVRPFFDERLPKRRERRVGIEEWLEHVFARQQDFVSHVHFVTQQFDVRNRVVRGPAATARLGWLADHTMETCDGFHCDHFIDVILRPPVS